MMDNFQPGILESVPLASRLLSFQLLPDADPTRALGRLAEQVDPETVIGIGHASVARLRRNVPGLREPSCLAGPEISMPATPSALWVWLRGTDRGDLLHRGRAYEQLLSGAYQLEAIVDGFRYRDSRDLTGYVDGTENPEGDDATAAAFVANAGAGYDGGSFVAVQTWLHDLSRFASFSPSEQDDIFGRRRDDNEEFDEAPESAHVKRAAQESFTPEAFILRRSMPWADGDGEGLVFVAFGRTFDAFEAIQRRMVGLEDGLTDALFRFTQPVTSSYYWCPPVLDGKLDLRALGL